MAIEFTDLLEPSKLYRTVIKDAHHENVVDYFDNLVKKANVDVELNVDTIRKINLKNKEIEKETKKRNSKASLGTFLLVTSIIFFVVSLIMVLIAILGNHQNPEFLICILVPIVLIGLGVYFLILKTKKLKPMIAKMDQKISKLKEERDNLINEAKIQASPLNALFEWNIPAKLITKTCPLIQLDERFDKNKFQYLHEKYGFKENEEANISSLFIQSGSILGNPFIIERNYVQEMGQHTYSNSIVITWTTTVRTSNGTRTVTHTQTLTATVTKPAPFYYQDTWLVYSNDAAPRLHFSRKPVNVDVTNEKALAKYVKEFDKKEDKMAEKALQNGKSFTEMSNTEFEALFNALDRDNDVEFRLLWTPLAQKSMLDLLKNPVPYGDDFHFIKDGPLNYIKSKHSQTFDYDGNPANFTGYDIRNMRNFFIDYCDDYMKNFFFDMAPLMSIPLYQQHQTFEYIYEGGFPTNVSSFETEIMANKFGQNYFKHQDSATPAILKRTCARANGKADQATITAYSFKTIPHIEVVTKMGRDGCLHSIPVEWLEYIPIEQSTEFSVQEVNTTKQQFSENLSSGKFDEIMSKYSTNNTILFQRGLISFLASAAISGYNGEELNNIFLKKEN